MRVLLLLCSWLALGFSAAAVGPWKMAELEKVPAIFPGPKEFEQPGLESFFFQGLSLAGKPTRVFAYLGMPEHAPGTKVPAMVLVHGGGGTAFPDWVRRWNQRGYAAIALDTAGGLPGKEHGKRPRHEWSGPEGWGGFNQTEAPLMDQWPYHAVADVILAHTLLRSRPEVDASRVGLTGISWGGYLTCVVAGVDARFRFAAPVYGCGFLMDNSAWIGRFAAMSPAGRETWRTQWEPSNYLGKAKMPMLWVTGTNDFAFPLDSLQKSYRLPQGERMLAVRLRMPHGQLAGEEPPEIHALADHLLKDGPPPWAKLGPTRLEVESLWATLTATKKPAKAELLYTTDTGLWKDRTWVTKPVMVAEGTRELMAARPPGATVAYFNVYDEKDCVVSSEHLELPGATPAP